MEIVKKLKKQITIITSIAFVISLCAIGGGIVTFIQEAKDNQDSSLTTVAIILIVLGVIALIASFLGFLFLVINLKVTNVSEFKATGLLDFSIILGIQSAKIDMFANEGKNSNDELKFKKEKPKKKNKNIK